jgi:Mg/Co/Ni transporter MgtE
VGRITIDDVVDVIIEAPTSRAAAPASTWTDMFAPIFRSTGVSDLARHQPVDGVACGAVINQYEHTIEKVVVRRH